MDCLLSGMTCQMIKSPTLRCFGIFGLNIFFGDAWRLIPQGAGTKIHYFFFGGGVFGSLFHHIEQSFCL